MNAHISTKKFKYLMFTGYVGQQQDSNSTNIWLISDVGLHWTKTNHMQFSSFISLGCSYSYFIQSNFSLMKSLMRRLQMVEKWEPRLLLRMERLSLYRKLRRMDRRAPNLSGRGFKTLKLIFLIVLYFIFLSKTKPLYYFYWFASIKWFIHIIPLL